MSNMFVFAIMLCVTTTALMMIYAIVKHTVEKSFYLIFLSVANLFFAFGNLLKITAPTLETAFYGVRVQYMAAPFLMPLTIGEHFLILPGRPWSGARQKCLPLPF